MDQIIFLMRRLHLPALLRILGLGKPVSRFNSWNLHRVRAAIASRYLRGCGLEIGALHFPLRLPKNAQVLYLDRASQAENIRRYTDVNPTRIVRTDIIANGFKLTCLAPSSLDFIIANHVLEHTDNALEALRAWACRLRPGGHLFITLPIAEKCYDRGRSLTPLAHFIDDQRLALAENHEELTTRNLEHYREWVCISERHLDTQPLPEAAARKRWEALATQKAEIHFHTFSPTSLAQLLEYFCTHTCPEFHVMEQRVSGGEVIALLGRST